MIQESQIAVSNPVAIILGGLGIANLFALGTLIFKSGREFEKLNAVREVVTKMEANQTTILKHEGALSEIQRDISDIKDQKSEVTVAKILTRIENLENRITGVNNSLHDVKNVLMASEGFSRYFREMQRRMDAGRVEGGAGSSGT